MSIQHTGLLSVFPTDIQKEILLKVENASTISHLQLTSKADKAAVDRILPLIKMNILKKEGLDIEALTLKLTELCEHAEVPYDRGVKGSELNYPDVQSMFVKYISKYQYAFPLSPVTNQADSPAIMADLMHDHPRATLFNSICRQSGSVRAFLEVWKGIQDDSTGLIDIEKAKGRYSGHTVASVHNCLVMMRRINDILAALDKVTLS